MPIDYNSTLKRFAMNADFFKFHFIPYTIDESTPAYLAGFTSGCSPIAEYIADIWSVEPAEFVAACGWMLSNNGLVMLYPIMLN